MKSIMERPFGIQQNRGNTLTENAGPKKTILQLTKGLVKVPERPTTKIGLVTGRSLQRGIQDGNILVCYQQAFVSSSDTKYSAMRKEFSRMKKCNSTFAKYSGL